MERVVEIMKARGLKASSVSYNRSSESGILNLKKQSTARSLTKWATKKGINTLPTLDFVAVISHAHSSITLYHVLPEYTNYPEENSFPNVRHEPLQKNFDSIEKHFQNHIDLVNDKFEIWKRYVDTEVVHAESRSEKQFSSMLKRLLFMVMAVSVLGVTTSLSQ
jgi:hypothetical protein